MREADLIAAVRIAEVEVAEDAAVGVVPVASFLIAIFAPRAISP